MRTEPIDCSAAWDAIEAERDTPRELSEQDWELLEALSAAGGPDGDGDLRRWGQPSTARLLQLLETPGPRLQNAVSLLLLARRDDIAEALVTIDDDRSFLAQLTDRATEIDVARNRRVPRGPRGPRPSEPAPPAPKGPPADHRDAERWEQALADPETTLAKVAEVMGGEGSEQARMRRMATLLGIRQQENNRRVMADAELRVEVNERLVRLGGEPLWPEPLDPLAERWAAALADPLAAFERVVELRTSPGRPRDVQRRVALALGIDSRRPVATLRAEIAARLEQLEDSANRATGASVVITPGEPAGPPPLTAEVLITEAWAREPMQPTTRRSLDSWELLTARGEAPDWRRHFGMLSDHHGPSAAAAISGVAGVPYQEVVAYAGLLRERHQEDVAELRNAYSDAEGLLGDALTAPGWEWLSAGLTVRIEALWQRCRELTADPRTAG